MEQGIVKLSDKTRDDVDSLHCEINGYNFYFTSKHADDTLAEYEQAVPNPMDRARDVLRGLESLRDEVDVGEYEYYADCILEAQPAEKPDRTAFSMKHQWMQQAKNYYLELGSSKNPDAPYEVATNALIEDGYTADEIKKITRRSGDAAWNETARDILARPSTKEHLRAIQEAKPPLMR